VAELISLRDHFADSIKAVSTNDEEILALRELLQQKKEEATAFAIKLTKARKSVAPQIESQIKDQLMQLGMPNSQFKVEISTAESLSHNGSDQVNFLFTANKNGTLNEISKVASGGELSRLMLAIKALISKSKALPTIIFDEIDSGISGEIADKMGTILKGISADMQVINITHLPQIAAKGDHHYLVYKFDTAEETITHLRLLSKNERVDELAKMLSGENITHAAILNAEELLK
jgi:DNA repair protein RecN (Recombination protein N)